MGFYDFIHLDRFCSLKRIYWNADDADFDGLSRIFCFEPHRSIVFFDCMKGASLWIVCNRLFAKANLLELG